MKNAEERQYVEEVTQYVRELVLSRRRKGIDWITEELLARHPNHHGEDAAFHACFSRRGIDALVESAAKRVTMKDVVASAQTDMSRFVGFESFQPTFLINRELVPVEQMTVEDCDTKLAEYERNIAGNINSRNDMRRLRTWLVEQQQGQAA